MTVAKHTTHVHKHTHKHDNVTNHNYYITNNFYEHKSIIERFEEWIKKLLRN